MKSATSTIDEVRAIRDSMAKQYDYDVAKIAEAIRQRQATSGRTYVRLSPRTPVNLVGKQVETELQQRKSA